MKRVVVFMCRIVEIVVVLVSVLICMEFALSGHDNLEFGIERITGITGYKLDKEHASLILHKTNRSDSIVMMSDDRTVETIMEQMKTLVETDDRWNFAVGAVVGAAIGATTQIISNVASGNNWTDGVGTAEATGEASGLLAASGVGLAGAVVGNAAISMAGNAANQVIENGGFEDFDAVDMLVDGAAGAVSGAIGGSGMGKAVNIRTLNRNLTKKVFYGTTDVAKKGVRYYVSQTKKLYIDKLLVPMRNSAIFSGSYGAVKGMYSRFR